MSVCKGGLDEFMSAELDEHRIAVSWLGQAGFILRTPHALILIDPYLSDHLAEKYCHAEFAHRRMMPPPVSLDDLAGADSAGVDWVLCSHRHSDHMDPLALPLLAARFPTCCFVVPAAERQSALDIGLPKDRIVCIDANQSLSLCEQITLKAIPSAHETFKQNALGEHHFLGYILKYREIAIYHSGDCVPYDGLAEGLREESVDVALLPVNGRDDYRRERGVPGNMDFREATALCHAAGIPQMIVHHFGMFDFNTVDERQLRSGAEMLAAELSCHIPATGQFVIIATP